MLQQTRVGPRRVVIAGCTSTGASVAVSLSNMGHSVHILDETIESFERIPGSKRESGSIVPVVGDWTSQRDMLKVSIRDADVFMALSESDTRNALASEIAHSIFQVPTIVSRIDDPFHTGPLTMRSASMRLGPPSSSPTWLSKPCWGSPHACGDRWSWNCWL